MSNANVSQAGDLVEVGEAPLVDQISTPQGDVLDGSVLYGSGIAGSGPEGSGPEGAGPEGAGPDGSAVQALPALDFFDLTREGLEKVLEERFALPKYRAQQIFQWVYTRRVQSFAEMSNIAKPLRDLLAGGFLFPTPVIKERQISSDGTRKYLFEVDGGDLVETVMIKQPNRMTLCVSSQVGCAMGCKFCRTATMGLKRQLRTSEIIQQVLGVIDDAKNFNDMFQNMVFMGMGEPLHNFEGVTNTLRILKDAAGLGMSGRKITISSVGLVPAITAFGETGLDTNLAISLNATDDETRSQIMPLNRKYPLEVLIECLRQFPLSKRKRITIEYVMLAGVNDRAEDLKRLPQLLRGIPVKMNLIPYNLNAGLGFDTPTREHIAHWQRELMRHGLETTVRWSKGRDIDAACGQLVTDSRRKKLDRSEVATEPKIKSLATVPILDLPILDLPA